jgi:hypothetical protein
MSSAKTHDVEPAGNSNPPVGIDPRSWGSAIKEAAKTPPGIIALVMLVVVIALTAAAPHLEGTNQTILVIGMIAVLFAVLGILLYLTRERYMWPGIKNDGAQTCPADVERIRHPAIVCVSSSEYDAKGYPAKGFEIVENRMGKGIRLHKTVTIQKEVNLAKWPGWILENKPDILHIAAQVDPKDGSIDFGNGQRYSATHFRALVREAKTRLVVLATCDSIPLGAAILRETNMIASTGPLKGGVFLEWADVFYMQLAKGAPLSRAYHTATSTVGEADRHMVLLLNRDVAFK